jgi:diguanylate cyclase (GGDEF)-like protein
MDDLTGAIARPRLARGRLRHVIRVVAGADMLRFCVLTPGVPAFIGRDESCELLLTDPSVSRKHVQCTCDDEGRIEIVDLGSTNGTRHDGRPITRITARIGDRFDVGDVVVRIDGLADQELAHLQRVSEKLEAANHDALTGLLARRWLDENLTAFTRRYTDAGMPVTCLFVDIDHFKSVNDTFGHPVGDLVLTAVARIVALSIRSSDRAVRYGGEEMVVILGKCDEPSGWVVADRIRAAIAEHAWSTYGLGDRKVTASIGVATTEGGAEPVEAWIARADRALYIAKGRGRDRAVRWSLPD